MLLSVYDRHFSFRNILSKVCFLFSDWAEFCCKRQRRGSNLTTTCSSCLRMSQQWFLCGGRKPFGQHHWKIQEFALQLHWRLQWKILREQLWCLWCESLFPWCRMHWFASTGWYSGIQMWTLPQWLHRRRGQMLRCDTKSYFCDKLYLPVQSRHVRSQLTLYENSALPKK